METLTAARGSSDPPPLPPDCPLLVEWTASQRATAAAVIHTDDVPWALPPPPASLFPFLPSPVHPGAPQSPTDRRNPPRLVGGADVSFPATGGAAGVATLTVCHWPSGVLLYSRSADVVVDAPYVPGFLAFREVPPVVSLLGAYAADVGLPLLPAAPNEAAAPRRVAGGDGDRGGESSWGGGACSPLGPYLDVLLCDGNGVLHPRGAGMACSVGVASGIPTVGVAKQLHSIDGLDRTAVAAAIAAAPADVAAVPLVGESGVLHGAAYMGAIADPRRRRGGGGGGGNHGAAGADVRPCVPPAPGQTATTTPLVAPATAATAAVAGTPLQPLAPHPRLTRPVYVSVGHRVSLSTALALVASVTPTRVPAPIRAADAHSRAALRGDRVAVCEAAALAAVAGGGGEQRWPPSRRERRGGGDGEGMPMDAWDSRCIQRGTCRPWEWWWCGHRAVCTFALESLGL